MRLRGMPRFSMDWDLFVPPRDAENFRRLNEALEDILDEVIEPLGPKGEGFVQTFTTRWGTVQFHLVVPGLRDFSEAEKASEIREGPEQVPIVCLSGRDLLAAKEAANRPQDQTDLVFLREQQRLGRL